MMRSVAARTTSHGFRSIFSPATARERSLNFEDYWLYTLENDGELIEEERDLTKKRELRTRLQDKAVRARRPLSDPQRFYRNHLKMLDDPRTLDDLARQFPAITQRIFENGQVRRFVNVYLNDEDIRHLDNLATPVKDGDELAIIPAVAGG